MVSNGNRAVEARLYFEVLDLDSIMVANANVNPDTWSVPSSWHPDWDAEWQLEQLKRLALKLIRQSSAYQVRLDRFDEGYLKVDIFKSEIKIGEVYVNRCPSDNNLPLYNLFLGIEEQEDNVSNLDWAVDIILKTQSA